MVLARRRLSFEEAKKFEQMFSSEQREICNKEGRFQEAATFVEQNLEILGIAAIIDRLQSEVPQTI